MAALHPLSFLFFFTFLTFSPILAISQVPPSKQFRFVSQGDAEIYEVEYGASYRVIKRDSLLRFPFQLCFYYPFSSNAQILGIGMGTQDSPVRWVWDANRSSPVRENATLTFASDGNLILKDVDGRVAWQTATAGKGVTDISLLPNGNLVLLDKTGKFVWQSFDHPTDTLLVGQALRYTGPNKLVARTSDSDPRDGPYSMVLEPGGLTLRTNTTGSPLIYGGYRSYGGVASVTFEPELTAENNAAFILVLVYTALNQTAKSPTARHLNQVVNGGQWFLMGRLNYNATLSFLRLGSDGNLRTFTFYDKLQYYAWAETWAHFKNYQSECYLPAKCGSFGLCDRGMCVACPSPKELLGWSDACRPPKLGACRGGAGVDYYKLAGVENFIVQNSEGEGPIKVGACREKCSKDCKCAGFFYRESSSKCFLAPTLGTLNKVPNVAYLEVTDAYIKYSK